MTRYPVHVGSIPAYQLREMDRLNEPYRKERPMTDDPGEREALIEEDENLVLLRRLDEWDEVGPYAPGPLIRWAAAALRGCIALSPDPVSEPVDGLRAAAQAVYDRFSRMVNGAEMQADIEALGAALGEKP